MGKTCPIKKSVQTVLRGRVKVEEERPWGNFVKFTENISSTVKIITVNPYKKLSLQYHKNRDEFWRVIKGECLITVGEEVCSGFEGDEFFIPRELKHRITGLDSEAQILEISFGNFQENDIVRLEDDYNREEFPLY